MENLTELGKKSYNLCNKYSYHLYLIVHFLPKSIPDLNYLTIIFSLL